MSTTTTQTRPQPVEIVERLYWTNGNKLATEYATFEEALAAAREEQRPLSWGGHTRAWVMLRQSARFAGGNEIASGSEHELLRYEVYPDRVALCHEGTGGMSFEQRADVLAAAPTHRGFA